MKIIILIFFFLKVFFQLNSLHKILDNYIKVKCSNDHEIIINFIQDILLNLSLWSEDTLKEKSMIIYPK